MGPLPRTIPWTTKARAHWSVHGRLGSQAQQSSPVDSVWHAPHLQDHHVINSRKENCQTVGDTLYACTQCGLRALCTLQTKGSTEGRNGVFAQKRGFVKLNCINKSWRKPFIYSKIKTNLAIDVAKSKWKLTKIGVKIKDVVVVVFVVYFFFSWIQWNFFLVVLRWKLWRGFHRDEDFDSINYSTVCPYSSTWLVQTHLHESWTARLHTRWDEEYLRNKEIKPLFLREHSPLTSVLQQCRSFFMFSSRTLSD